MELSQQQVQFFQHFGYLQIAGLFNADETADIAAAFEHSIRLCGGAFHDGSRRTMMGGPIEHTAALNVLLDDPRILGLAGGLLGHDFNYAGGDGNYYSGDTPWHPDGNWGKLFACKIAFYLDPVDADSGCLRVIPGSQHPHHPLRTEQINPNQSAELFHVSPDAFPGAVALPTQPGDVLIFNHDLWHASFGGSQRRRMFTMNLTRHAHTTEDMELLRAYIAVHSPGGYKCDIGGMYFKPLLETADAQRMLHLSQCLEMHRSLFPEYDHPMTYEEQIAGLSALECN